MAVEEDEKAFQEWLQKEAGAGCLALGDEMVDMTEQLRRAFLAGAEYERNIWTSD